MDDGTNVEIASLTDFEKIGAGGFGSVYRAWDSRFQRTVAVKVFGQIDQAARRRFEREAKIMGFLSGHTGIVTPHDAGVLPDGRPYLVMEYLDGGSLQALINEQGRQDWRTAVSLLVPVADALAYAHSRHVLHRDIKPDNILRTSHGRTKITDFGISAIKQGTAFTCTAFSLEHTPPETFDGGPDRRDERSDVYSLASTLYTLLEGRPPYGHKGDVANEAYMFRILSMPIPKLVVSVPDSLSNLVDACLAKESELRPDMPEALTQLLESLRGGAHSDPVKIGNGDVDQALPTRDRPPALRQDQLTTRQAFPPQERSASTSAARPTVSLWLYFAASVAVAVAFVLYLSSIG